jgi:DNA primase
VDVIKERIHLMPAGKNYKAICPFHKEKTPSFVVSPDRQSWHCFGSCNEGGDMFSFVMKYENIEFYEALKLLAEKAGIELQRADPAMQREFGVLYDIQASAEEFFVQQLQQSPDAIKYIKSRGITEETQEVFGIGYAPHEQDALLVYLVNKGYDTKDIDRAGLIFKTERGTFVDRFRGRIMFPLRNGFGKTVGFSGRILPAYENEKTGKYINSPETPIFIKSKLLYGWDLAKSQVRDAHECVVVEGQMDLIMLHQDGVRYAVATSGTALTDQHIIAIRKLAEKIIFFFDNDEAGQLATERAIDMAHELDCTPFIFRLEEAKDAAEYIQKNSGRIETAIRSGSVDALVYYIKRYIPDIAVADIKQRIRVILEKLRHIPSPVEQARWIRTLARHTHLMEHTIREEQQMLQKNTEKFITQKNPRASVPFVSAIPAETRREKIAVHIMRLIIAAPETVWVDIDAYRPFIPESLCAIFDALQHKEVSQEIQELAKIVEMQSSLYTDSTLSDPQKALIEARHSLQELKKEYFKERRIELQKKIQDAERAGLDTAPLLKEFDEITYLIDNEENHSSA